MMVRSGGEMGMLLRLQIVAAMGRCRTMVQVRKAIERNPSLRFRCRIDVRPYHISDSTRHEQSIIC